MSQSAPVEAVEYLVTSRFACGAELDVPDFGGGAFTAAWVQPEICPSPSRQRLLGTGGRVDRERVVAKCPAVRFSLTFGISALTVPRRSRRITAPSPLKPSYRLRGCAFFSRRSASARKSRGIEVL